VNPLLTSSVQTIKLIDAKFIRPSIWANRAPQAFLCSDYEMLKKSIAEVGRNIQPIKIRPIESSSNAKADESPNHIYEIVFGHRRHRACLDLEYPVHAVVESMSDSQLFAEMDRENRLHKPLSPFEQGLMFKSALEKMLYANARALSEALCIDAALVSKSLSIANLPTEIIQAFNSPLDIQYRWAGPLNKALRSNPTALLIKAQVIRCRNDSISSVKVFQQLVSNNLSHASIHAKIDMKGVKAIITKDTKGRLAVLIDPPWEPSLPASLENALRNLSTKP
jgi:ParB family chromosome partitioning protein